MAWAARRRWTWVAIAALISSCAQDRSSNTANPRVARVSAALNADDGGAEPDAGMSDADGDGLADAIDPCPSQAHMFGPHCEVDTSSYTLIYDLNLPVDADWDTPEQIAAAYSYNVANDYVLSPFTRFGYLMTLDGNYVWATGDDFSHAHPEQLGIPVDWTLKTSVTHLDVSSNVPGVGANDTYGGVEMWSNCYSPGANGVDDYDDQIDAPDCYGSFQVSVNNDATVLAYNAWSSPDRGADDVGLGQRATDDPDWTLASNTASFSTRRIQVFILADTDRDGTADDTDTDDDNDGIDDAHDVAKTIATQCRDVDSDGCDDCTNTGANAGGGDPAHDCVVHNCADIHDVAPTAPSGVYAIDPDGAGPEPPLRAYCDMQTDGGGWTLALNYVHAAWTFPALAVRNDDLPLFRRDAIGDDGSSDPLAWGHAGNALLNKLDVCELRFDARSSDAAHRIHFKSTEGFTLRYARTGAGSMAAMSQDFTPLPDHDAVLPAGASEWAHDQGDLALTEAPFGSGPGSSPRWSIGGDGGDDWNVDEHGTAGSLSTIHRVWFRSKPGDPDGDGFEDCNDNCPNAANPDQADHDADMGDGGDACDDDDDDDGVKDVDDSKPFDPDECKDSDTDGCDDCSVTGFQGGGGSTQLDGTDTDQDGICDAGDLCPNDAQKRAPGRCGCGVDDAVADPDADSACGDADACPNDADKTALGRCGCGVVDAVADADEDGACGDDDACPSDPNKTALGRCGCGVVDADADADGDSVCGTDGCPEDPNKSAAGTCGCGLAEDEDVPACKNGDADGDGLTNAQECPDSDACPDTDGDGEDDYLDTDSDGDGEPDASDAKPIDPCKPDADALACKSGDADDDGVSNGDDKKPTDPCVPKVSAKACDKGGTGGTGTGGTGIAGGNAGEGGTNGAAGEGSGTSGTSGKDGAGGMSGAGGTNGGAGGTSGGSGGTNGEGGANGGAGGDTASSGSGADAGDGAGGSDSDDGKHGGGGCSTTGAAPATQLAWLLLPEFAVLRSRRRTRAS